MIMTHSTWTPGRRHAHPRNEIKLIRGLPNYRRTRRMSPQRQRRRRSQNRTSLFFVLSPEAPGPTPAAN